MCGIVASVAPRGSQPRLTPTGRMERMLHRGPDGVGWSQHRAGHFDVSLGMCRLTIVDQRKLEVPFHFERLGVVLAYNGEIYNWRELRTELKGPWETECDSEVLAAAWRTWGLTALTRFNGMFSFVLLDLVEGMVFAARDRLGQKPLYYAQEGETLHFASEAKALPIPLHEAFCADAETLEYDVLKSTPLEGVKRLLPGHYMLLRSSEDRASPRAQSWWSLPPYEPTSSPGLLDELEHLVLDSVKLRAKAEVPVTIQFSGGLDSTLIFYAAQHLGLRPALHAVTFDEIDHLSAARAGAGSAPLQSLTITRELFFEALPKAAYHLDTPATWTAVCQYLLNQVIAQTGGRVILSGEGADELFCGYTRYRVLYWLQQALQDSKLDAYLPLITRALQHPEAALIALLDRGDNSQTQARAADWIAQYGGPPQWPLWYRLARTETHTTMQVLLRMADRMAAAWSLENRCPFLDYRIVELSVRVPPERQVNEQENKSLLRDLARRWALPPSIINEQTKRGLAVPWRAWAPPAGRDEDRSLRGAWDRRSFAKLMHQHWRDTILS